MAQSSSSSTMEYKNDYGVLCNCKRAAKIVKAWTNDNPGRRFYACTGRRTGHGYESCNFFRWYDVEKPHGWQHLALLEARDVIRDLKEEIMKFKKVEREPSREIEHVIENPSHLEDELMKTRQECEALKGEVLVLTERSTIYCNVLLSSTIGFTVALGVIFAMSKL
ncbi:uncharacterized protein LOC112087804 [Eutrema salsugineum]|uniref:uncharacterized protein LOC112087804 n=1 Tax=Eutrema salsugineum TaxID=72664 RepID=UPI000CED64E5|nr:uncharacterized protein LOC112087804 [Eutrema salsugineum]